MYSKYEKLLKERGVRSSDVSTATGIAQSTLTDWKKGRTKYLSSENIRKIADFFEVPVDYFYAASEDEKELYEILKKSSGKNTEIEKNYYNDPYVQKIAEAIYENDGMRTLFNLAEDASEDDINMVIDMLKRFKGE